MSAPLTARARAQAEQLVASDPEVSAFVAASAGSGKTKLLTDRLLRLMLAGAAPARIQCLTFTKAAAAEMALRLQRVLGGWVTMDDAALDAALLALRVEPDADRRRTARALFAEVLDLPGGMRIGTIHAFCQSLLRRFPLEAQISPHFELIEEADAREAMREARETMLATAGTLRTGAILSAMEGVATLLNAEEFGKLVTELATDERRLRAALDLGPEMAAAQRRAVGASHLHHDAVMAAAVEWAEEHALREAMAQVAREASPGCAKATAEALTWFAHPPEKRMIEWPRWSSHFLKVDGTAKAATTLVNKALANRCPDLAPLLLAEATRIEAVRREQAAVRVATVSAALLMLAAPVLARYGDRKTATGSLDYADLIGRTSALLVDPGAAWVLYKLDGGLDHLLLDEVQDTAPLQWDIAHALTGEFFAGSGAQETTRTVFAVGDRKQSIFSFQGADVATFDIARERLGRRVQDSGLAWRETTLDVSFRSTAPVLALVDRVFAAPDAAAGVVEPGGVLSHLSDRAEHAGCVELWPLVPRPDSVAADPTVIPNRNQGSTSAPQTLAETLAAWIRAQTSGGVLLESKGRPLAPGDVMILLRRRNAFAEALVRSLKVHGVPVAGLDRLVLTDQPAVQDLMALCDTLLLPQDDLALACVLTSPLGGLTDDSLMHLAMERSTSLFETLRSRAEERADWRAAWQFLSALLARVDYVSPYSLLMEVLGPLGGRGRLYARLGAEAAEPVDELLASALDYARTHPPSLQGFLHWLRQSGAEVKREMEAAGGTVRIMTVHNAKGLQAPLVILPDTTSTPPDTDKIAWATDPQTGVEVPIWSPIKDIRCEAFTRLRDEAKARDIEEYNRLLYVALTRAEDRLVVCGWEADKQKEMCWYNLVARGFAALDTESEPFQAWEGRILHHRSPQVAPVPAAIAAPARVEAAGLPAWVGSAPTWQSAPPPAEPARPEPLAPSRPEGDEFGPPPPAVSPLALQGTRGDRFRRGQAAHTLLQHLPNLPAEERAAAAAAWLARKDSGLSGPTAASLCSEVLAVLDHPDLAALFGPGSRAEVPLTGIVGQAVIGGLVDRLVVLPDQVLIADFKTDRTPPECDEGTPVRYLRQLSAYREVLRAIYPDRPIRCVLIWTQTACVRVLAARLLDLHAPGTAALSAAQHNVA